jgi:hypothetical protein
VKAPTSGKLILAVTFVTSIDLRTQPVHVMAAVKPRALGTASRFVLQLGFFDGHVFEFTGVKNFAAFQAFHELRVFVAGYDLNTRVFTW